MSVSAWARWVVVLEVAALALLAGCSTAPAATALAPSAPASNAVPSPVDTAAPSLVAMLPDTLVGTWTGTEFDFTSGENWDMTYRLNACHQQAEIWKAPTEHEVCGAWVGTATIKGLPAHCEATLSWIGMDGATFQFQARGPKGAKYRSYPHPYLEEGGKWYCWDSFIVRLTPDGSNTLASETLGDAQPATEGSVARSGS
jgi:hypothetical protein